MRKDLDWPLLIVAALMLMLYALTQAIKPRPLLMGIGCENASGPLYAMEEDHFPLCKEIIPYD